MAIFLLHLGDSMERVVEPSRGLQPDLVICDPPYGLEFMGRSWDRIDGDVLHDPSTVGGFQDGSGGNPYSRSRIRYGREPSGMQKWHIQWLEACYEALPPGGEVWAFSGTRTMHSLAVAFEMAGFDVQGLVAWVYGSGFPKSLNVAKALDKMAGAKREPKKIAFSGNAMMRHGGDNTRPWIEKALEAGFHELPGDEAVTEDAQKWDGWGTAIKPAWEPVIVGRKPKE